MRTISQKHLQEHLTYIPETGEFWWNIARKGRMLHRRVGTISNFGYRIITIDCVRYVASRLAWLYMTGEMPVDEIDHINRDRSDDRWINLREASRSENACNTKIRSDNSSGYRGICWDKQKMKWKVQISVANGKRLNKHFCDLDEAVSFYKENANVLHGEFAADEICESSQET